jgi:hypothetical protein
MTQRIIEEMNGSGRQSATPPQPLQSFIKPFKKTLNAFQKDKAT